MWVPNSAVRAGLQLWAALRSFGQHHIFTLTLVYTGPGLVSYLASVSKPKPLHFRGMCHCAGEAGKDRPQPISFPAVCHLPLDH